MFDRKSFQDLKIQITLEKKKGEKYFNLKKYA